MIALSQCKHYQRNCDKLAPCCKIFYPCRICHDENYYKQVPDGCKVETMDRYSVSTIKCRQCLVEQPVSNQCQNCQIVFARYFCDICKLYDDDKRKDIYNCDKCKMCRRGKKEENFHCDTCDVCFGINIKDNHKCLEKGFEQNCAVCMEYLKTSTKFIQQLQNCSHYIHVDCSQCLKKGMNNCPICGMSVQKMSQEQIGEYDLLQQQLIQNLPDQMKAQLRNIKCLVCGKISKNVQYNELFKCQFCGTYNTEQQV